MSRAVFVGFMLAAVAIGSVIFHFMSPWWFTELASNWEFIDTTIIITFWVTGVVFVAVLLFTAYCIWKFHHREGREVEYRPENHKLEWGLTIFTTVGVVAMLAPGLVVWDDFVSVPEDAVEFEAMGQQWFWSYRYPGADGVLGKTDVHAINYDNPFGIDPDDPHGQDDVMVEGDSLHLQIGQPVKVLLRSIDVLHNFYVPEFRAKMDLVPGMVTYFWIEPTREGEFDVLCFELCGTGHYNMLSKVIVEDKESYDAWMAEQLTFAEYAASFEGGAKVAMNDASINGEGEAAAPAAVEAGNGN